MKKFLHPLIFLLLFSVNSFAQTLLFSDDFESYTADGKLAEQASGSEWSTWSSSPGTSEDATVSTEQAYSGTKSAKVITGNDLILNLGEKTAGRYQVKFQLYVESNKGAFFGFMQDFDAGDAVFGLSVYFNLDTGNISAGGNEFQFDFPFDTWMLVNVIIDLDDDFATMYIDGTEIASWVWSLGSDGTSDLAELDGIDFWGYSDENGCSYYLDDVEYNQLESLDPPTNLTSVLSGDNISLSWDAPSTGSPTGYGIIRNNKSIDQTSGTTYDDNGLYPMGYTYSVRANYGDKGYSAPTNEVSERVAGGVSRKNVLFEVGTGTWCQYCPGAAMGIHDLLENDLDFAAVKYHSGDEYEFTDGKDRLGYYNISSFPTSKIDGILTVSGGSNSTSLYSSYKPLYDQRIGIPSTHDIDIKITKTDATNYQAQITVSEEYAYYADNLVLITALTESEIADTWQNQTEVNYACRDLYPDENGTSLDFSSSSTQVVNIDIILDASWVAENCELVAFVQYNTTKEVVQTVKTKITAPSVSISIADGSTNIDVDEDIVFTFSEPIRHLNNDTITQPDTMIVFKQDDASGNDVAFTASINDEWNEITVSHDSLDENTTYYVQLSSYIENFYDIQVEDDLTVTFTTKAPAGITDLISKYNLKTYPIPSSGVLNFEFNLGESANIKVEIFGSAGQLIKTDAYNITSGNQKITIETNSLDNGFYFARLKINEESITQKIQIIK